MSIKINMNLNTILASGQCFRMSRLDDDTYMFITRGKVLQIQDIGSNHFKVDCSDDEWETFWSLYFDINNDAVYDEYRKLIDPKDTYLVNASNKCPGLRILWQEPFEVGVSQIIEQRNTQDATLNIIHKLTKYYGRHIALEQYEFPSPSVVADMSISDLEFLGMGYRAKYVKEFATKVADGTVNLNSLYKCSDDVIDYTLQSVKGIGPKVSASIAVLAYHRLSFFPVDTWIQKVFDKYYPGGLPSLTGEVYGKYGAIAQMCMRTYARKYNGLG